MPTPQWRGIVSAPASAWPSFRSLSSARPRVPEVAHRGPSLNWSGGGGGGGGGHILLGSSLLFSIYSTCKVNLFKNQFEDIWSNSHSDSYSQDVSIILLVIDQCDFSPHFLEVQHLKNGYIMAYIKVTLSKIQFQDISSDWGSDWVLSSLMPRPHPRGDAGLVTFG